MTEMSTGTAKVTLTDLRMDRETVENLDWKMEMTMEITKVYPKDWKKDSVMVEH